VKDLDNYSELKGKLVEGLDEAINISRVQLSWMNLNNVKMIECMVMMAKMNDKLVEFDISNSSITLANFKQICAAIGESRFINYVNFSGINCLYQSNREKEMDLNEYTGTWYKSTMYRRKEDHEEIIGTLIDLIKNQKTLQHLDLSNLQLQKNILLLGPAIRESVSLLSVHLGLNDINLDDVQRFLVSMGIDYRDIGPDIAKQGCISDFPHA